jgi:hypothetical protein
MEKLKAKWDSLDRKRKVLVVMVVLVVLGAMASSV